MSEVSLSDLYRDLYFAVGRYVSCDDQTELWYEKVREAYTAIYLFNLRNKFGKGK